MTTSESPTHPDAPRAGGETPLLDNDFANAYPTLSALAVRYGTVKAELLDLLATRPEAAALLARHRDGERDTPAASQETDEERALQWYANAANIVAIPSTDVPLLGLFAREILRLRKERDEANACAERWMDELNPSASPDPERASK